MNKEYQICSKCIMDTTDPDITFDEKGICNHCHDYEKLAEQKLARKKGNKRKLTKLIENIKDQGKDKAYDCIIGVSGGVDSTFTILKLKEFGLRPLALHLDNGWDSEIAVSNMKKALSKLDIDFVNFEANKSEFKSLQLAFLKASVPDIEVPSDHAINGFLYNEAVERDIKYIISGANIVTESILPKKWSHGHADWKYIKNINKKFGTKPIDNIPHYSFWDMINYHIVKGIKKVYILNYLNYNKEKAITILKEELDWEYYGGKHYESIITRFVQGYILPKKFNIDKRRAHLSNLICSGQITRDEALERIKKDPYPSKEMLEKDMNIFLKKLDLTKKEFRRTMNLPPKTFWDYPSYENSILLGILWKHRFG